MHYKFYNETLNTMDTRNVILNKLQNKNLIILGDSLMDQMFEGVVEALELKLKVKVTFEKEKNWSRNYKVRKIYHGRNGYIKSLRFYNIYHEGISEQSDIDIIFLNTETLLQHIPENSHVILNFGLHYRGWTLLDFKYIVRKVMQLIKNKVKRGSLILRTTPPQHFPTEVQSGRYEDYQLGDKCVNVPKPERHPADMIVEHFAKEYNLSILDDFTIFQDRWDLHQQTKYHKLDCTHFCYTPATFIPHLTLLTQLI